MRHDETAGRLRHPDPDLEKLLRLIERNNWTVTKPSKYFRCACPCGLHLRWVHLTPYGNYGNEARRWFERQDCWEGKP